MGRPHARAHVLSGVTCALHACIYRVYGEQGSVVCGFAGANKCTVKARQQGYVEYDPHIKHGTEASTKVAVVASRSVCAGDNFTVVQMGTLGEVGSVHQQLAVLVLVRSAHEQSKARHEVFTAEQLRPLLQMVEWRRCGLPAMDEAKVSVCTAPQIAMCVTIYVQSYMLP